MPFVKVINKVLLSFA